MMKQPLMQELASGAAVLYWERLPCSGKVLMIVRFLTEDRCKGKAGKQALKVVGQSLLLEMVPPDTIEKQPRGFQNENLSAVDIFEVGYAAFLLGLWLFCTMVTNYTLMLWISILYSGLPVRRQSALRNRS